MKILFYISTLRGGGAAKVMSNIANYMSNSGHEITFVTNFPDSNDYYLVEGVERYNIDSREKKRLSLLNNLYRVGGLRRIIKRINPDLCLSFMGENNIRLLLANAWLKNKVIISVRNDPNMEYRHLHIRAFAKLLYPYADGIVFQTEDARKWFSPIIQSKSKIILNAVDEKFFKTQLDSRRKNIVSVGRLSKQKNHSMLIKAYSKIANLVEDDVYIYGEGSLRDTLKAEIDGYGLGNRVHLMGTSKDIPDVLRQAKVFVMTSDYEGMPNALMEALAIGIPCIATDCPCGGPKMLIENGENGILVPIGDDEKLSAELFMLLTDEEVCDKISFKAKKDSSSYRLEHVMREWIAYMEGVVEC